MKTNTFDCVRMKRVAQQKIRAAVAGLNRDREIEFFRAGADEFEHRLEIARASLSHTPRPDGP